MIDTLHREVTSGYGGLIIRRVRVEEDNRRRWAVNTRRRYPPKSGRDKTFPCEWIVKGCRYRLDKNRFSGSRV